MHGHLNITPQAAHFNEQLAVLTSSEGVVPTAKRGSQGQAYGLRRLEHGQQFSIDSDPATLRSVLKEDSNTPWTGRFYRTSDGAQLVLLEVRNIVIRFEDLPRWCGTDIVCIQAKYTLPYDHWLDLFCKIVESTAVLEVDRCSG